MRRRHFNRAVSFASALDPAFLHPTSALVDKGKGRAKGADDDRNDVRRAGEDRPRKAKSISARQATVLAMDQRGASPQPSRLYCNLKSEEVGEVTEPIADSTFDATVCNNIDSASPSTSRLAAALALETIQKDRGLHEKDAKHRQDLERRTSYGSVKRAMQRQSIRSIRTARQVASHRSAQGTLNDTVISDDVPYTQLRLAFSQESHHSIESDDGVYQTQFSFYRFTTDENEGKHGESQSACTEEQLSQKAISTDVSHESQGGYEADRSLSASNQPSIESIAADLPDTVERGACNDRTSINVYRLSSEIDVCPEQADNSDRKLARTVLEALNGTRHSARFLRPTIWHGHSEIDEFFGPITDGFVSSRCPPARADLARWADWMDSQSNSGDQTHVRRHSLFPDDDHARHALTPWSLDSL